MPHLYHKTRKDHETGIPVDGPLRHGEVPSACSGAGERQAYISAQARENPAGGNACGMVRAAGINSMI